VQTLGFILSLLLDVRAHIPNQPSFGSGPPDTSYGSPALRAIVAFLITVAFLSAVLRMAVRFVMGIL
jgi:hypothetical protein